MHETHNPDYLFMIEQAVKAPSGHNTQPWLFKINKNNIEIHPNFDKSLPVVDPDNRELFISLGCALENLLIAASAKGYLTDIFISNEGVITTRFSPGTFFSGESALVEQIPVRQTNRSQYNGKKISEDVLTQLIKITPEKNISIYWYENGNTDFALIASYIEKGNLLQMQDKAFKNELISWMRFNKNHSESTHDGLSYNVFGAPNLPKFISKAIISTAINERTQVKSDNKKIASASHLVLFTIRTNQIDEWINLGRTLQRFMLTSTQLGIAHSHFNQPNEIKELSEEMRGKLNLTDEIPALLLRVGYGKPMPYSKRKDIQQVMIK